MAPAVEDFLATAMPRFEEAEISMLNGDAGPRKAMWSHKDPVTVFGAAASVRTWSEIEPIFEQLAANFSNYSDYHNDILAAGASDDLAYVVALEHTTASIAGSPQQPFVLRVTTIFRREDGEWRVVHRHADPASENASALAQRMGGELRKIGAPPL
jgi:ketosteroid isomerase-like protein